MVLFLQSSLSSCVVSKRLYNLDICHLGALLPSTALQLSPRIFMVAMQQVMDWYCLVEVVLLVQLYSVSLCHAIQAAQPMPLHRNINVSPCQRMTCYYAILEICCYGVSMCRCTLISLCSLAIGITL